MLIQEKYFNIQQRYHKHRPYISKLQYATIHFEAKKDSYFDESAYYPYFIWFVAYKDPIMIRV